MRVRVYICKGNGVEFFENILSQVPYGFVAYGIGAVIHSPLEHGNSCNCNNNVKQNLQDVFKINISRSDNIVNCLTYKNGNVKGKRNADYRKNKSQYKIGKIRL